MRLLLTLFLLSSLALSAQQTYKGRPMVLVARQSNHPELGSVANFGSAQFFGDAVHWVGVDTSFTKGGLFAGNGGDISGPILPSTVLPGGLGQPAKAEFNFRSRASDGVTVANVTTLDSKLTYIEVAPDGALSVRFDTAGKTLPNSGGLPFSRLGEPNAVDGKVAFIGFHRNDSGVDDFRGVYVLDGDELKVLADSTTELPGIGLFEGSSSQVSYDGTTVAFWAAHGSIQAGDLVQGVFTSVVGGPITPVAVNGDLVPGTETVIHSFQSPPAVEGDTVYFVAFDASFQTYLLRSKSGVLETVAKTGDLVDGLSISQVAAFGPNYSEDTVYFDAMRGDASVILSKTGDGPVEVAIDNTVIPGFRQTFRVLDAEGDRLVIGERLSLYATIDEPDKPVITQQITAAAYDPGANVTLAVAAVGAGDLTYEWRLGNVPIENDGPSLNIPDFQAANAGGYSVTVSNANGQVTSRLALIEINSAPVITNAEELDEVVVDAGGRLFVSASVVGKAPFTYTWRKDGGVVEDQVSALLRILEAKAADGGQYTLTVSNELGETTSAPIRVTVNPAPPNPTFEGKQFVSRLSLPTTVDGLEVGGFRASFPHPDGLAIGFYDAAVRDLGVLLFRDAANPEVLLSVDEINAETGASYTNVFLNDVDEMGRLLVSTTTNGGIAFGVFVRETDGTIRTIATEGLSSPDDAGVTYRSVSGHALDGDRVLFGAAITQQSALLVDELGTKRVLIAAEAELPAEDFFLKAAVPSHFEDGSFLFTSFSSDFTKYGLFRYQSDGTIEALLATGDPLDADLTVGQFGFPSQFGDELYVYDFAGPLLKVGDRRATTALELGIAVDGGTLQAIRNPFAAQGDALLFEGIYRDASNTTRTGVLRWNDGMVEAVAVPTHIDERGVQFTKFANRTSSGTIWAIANFSDGSQVVLSNTGSGDGGETPADLPSLSYEPLPDGAGLRIQVPNGWMLERSANLRPPWTRVDGSGSVDVAITGTRMFFRLAK